MASSLMSRSDFPSQAVEEPVIGNKPPIYNVFISSAETRDDLVEKQERRRKTAPAEGQENCFIFHLPKKLGALFSVDIEVYKFLSKTLSGKPVSKMATKTLKASYVR